MIKKFFPILSVLAALAIFTTAGAVAGTQLMLPGKAIPQFVEQLPLLDAADGTINTVSGAGAVNVVMCEFKAWVLPKNFVLPNGQPYTGTWVWGYLPAPAPETPCAELIAQFGDANGVLDTYIGPVVLATRGIPTDFTWVNQLGNSLASNVLAYKNSTDQTLHWADPLNNGENMCNHMGMPPAFGSECAQNYDGPIPAVVHLHGGEVPPQLDGGPDAWVTSDGSYTGHAFYSAPTAIGNGALYRYPNTQEAAPIWFHDHTLGATRLNVYAGLAGGYLLKDDDQTLPLGLVPYGLSYAADYSKLENVTVPLVIQDRMFDADGQLFYQADSNGGILWTPNAEHPYWTPEFVGDAIAVNGKTWPFLNVEPKRYRFLFLNGSNARTYELFLIDPLNVAVPPWLWVIATDGGYLDVPVQIKKLVIMPGERYEVIVDFAGLTPGTNLILKNTAKTPFPGGATPQGATVGQIMQFRLVSCASGFCGTADTSYNPAVNPVIRTAGQTIQRLVNPATGKLAAGVTPALTRALTLNEVMGMPMTVASPVNGVVTAYPGGPLEVLVNNTKWMDAITETPLEGDTEVWEIINLTADAHPIHLHLVQFQLLNRQDFNLTAYTLKYNSSFPAQVYQPGGGPPLPYAPGNASGGKYGGNPDVGILDRKGKPLFLKGTPIPPQPYEAGWKDTVVAYPGQVTRIVVRWAPTDLPANTLPSDAFFPFAPDGEGFGHGYVWHCHIIDHEDNEMMRPDLVIPRAGATRTYLAGTDY